MDGKEVVQHQVIFILSGGKQGFEPGSFVKALINAALLADNVNAEKLRTVYPYLIGAVLAHQGLSNLNDYPIIKKFLKE